MVPTDARDRVRCLLRLCSGVAVVLASGAAISLTALTGGMVPALADPPVTETTVATVPSATTDAPTTAIPVTTADAPVTTADAPVTTTADAPVTTTADAPVTTTADAPVTTTADAPVTTTAPSSDSPGPVTTSETVTTSATATTTGSSETSITTASLPPPSTTSTVQPAQVTPTEEPQRLQAAAQDVALARTSVPVQENPDPAPQREIDRMRTLLSEPANPETAGANRRVLQWQPAWVDYDDYYRPVIFNPFREPLQIVFDYEGAPRILTIPPLKSAVTEVAKAGVYTFTVIVPNVLGIAPAVGTFLGGGYFPGPGLPPPPPPPPPVDYKNVLVVVKYSREIYEPIVVKQIIDVGDDPTLGERKVLLDGATPAWGNWTETPTGEPQFEIHKTQQFPGLDAPAEGPLPGDYQLQLASWSEPPSALGTILLIWVAAVVAGLGLSAIVVRIVRAKEDRLRRPPGWTQLPTCPGAFPSARVLNVAVVDTKRVVLPKSVVLAPDTQYEVQVEIHPQSVESVIDHTPPDLADQLQPMSSPGAWFDVLVVSSDVDVVSQLHRLYLPSSGPSWVCGCKEPQHTCSPEDRHPHLYVPMRTRSDVGQAHLRCIVYSRNNVVQSMRLDLMVGTGKAAGDNIRADIDFSLAGDVGDARLLPPRQLNVLTNESRTGTHTIAVNDGSHPIAVYLSDEEAAQVLAACRSKLTQIVLNKGGTGSNYDDCNRKSTEAFITDLKGLALLGSQLFSAVVPDRDDRAYLREQFSQRAKIQVTRVTRTVFPWALIYDIPREAAVPWTLCRLLQEWDTAAEQLASYPDGCPYQAEHPKKNVLCPYGFWGLRHLIEEPPSVKAGVLRDAIRVYPPAKAALVRSLALNPELTKQHFSQLQGCMSPPFELLHCDSRKRLQSAFADPTLPLAYFYCHGGKARLSETDLEIPVLQIGQDDQIAPGDFAAWDEADAWAASHWRDTAPLVFINGCETAKLMPEDIVSFVDALAGMHAAGVIGTEIPVDQTIAGEVAVRFYRQFCGGARTSVGMALHRVRIDLLRKGNISGLVYTPYCSMDLALEFVRMPYRSMSQDTAIAPPRRLPSQVTQGSPVSPDIAKFHIADKEGVAP
jgi:hypothetical protein